MKDLRNHPLVWKDNGHGGKHILMQFGPDIQMSIIDDGYGKEKGLYEIGVFHKGEMKPIYGITDKGSSVQGFLTEDAVHAKIKKLGGMVRYEPVQINVWEN